MIYTSLNLIFVDKNIKYQLHGQTSKAQRTILMIYRPFPILIHAFNIFTIKHLIKFFSKRKK